jgi:hypothetical protein
MRERIGHEIQLNREKLRILCLIFSGKHKKLYQARDRGYIKTNPILNILGIIQRKKLIMITEKKIHKEVCTSPVKIVTRILQHITVLLNYESMEAL